MSVRVTSRFGEVVEFPPIHAISTGARHTASNQFSVFPALDPKPVWILSPVYTDDFSSRLGEKWTASTYGGATVNPTDPVAAYQDAAGLSISGLAAFSGAIFTRTRAFPPPADGSFEFAIRSGSTTASNLRIQFGGTSATGESAVSAEIQLPDISKSWSILRIPLGPARTPQRMRDFRILNNTGATMPPIYLDSIFFRQP
jgi:hypothetical protein